MMTPVASGPTNMRWDSRGLAVSWLEHRLGRARLAERAEPCIVFYSSSARHVPGYGQQWSSCGIFLYITKF